MTAALLREAAILSACLLATTAHAQTYGPYPQETFTTCGNPSSKVAVEMAHGGAWVGGDDQMPAVAQLCTFLGNRGVYVMAVDYRLSGTAPWPAQLQDAQTGLAWLRAHSPAKRIGVIGMSAGGHIALSVGLSPAPVTFAQTDPLGETASVSWNSKGPDFVVDFSGPTDLTDMAMLPKAIPWLLNGLPMTDSASRAWASPIAHLDSSMPETLVSHGTEDEVVPVAQSDAFVTMARAVGANVVYDRHAGGHVFSKLGPEKLVLFKEVLAFVRGTK